ncbi:hypothetical protein ES707_05612 [subsurface metagenome]
MIDPKSRRHFMKTLGASGAVFAMNSGNAESREMNTDGQQNPHQPVNVSDINPGKVLLTELTRKEVREWFDTGNLKAAIIPTGSTEQHNEHMALSMDTEASMVISQLTALKLFPKVIVTTPVAFGICPFFMKRRGTITIREEIFVGLVYDICCSMKTHGINTILIVNGHGGNTRTLSNNVAQFSEELGITIDACTYWNSIPRDRRMEFTETGNVPGHADEFETSFALAAFPEKIRRVSYNEEDLYNWNPDQKDLDRVGYFDARWFSKEFDKSSFEESLLANAEKGERFISHAVEWTAEKLLTMMG